MTLCSALHNVTVSGTECSAVEVDAVALLRAAQRDDMRNGLQRSRDGRVKICSALHNVTVSGTECSAVEVDA